MIHDAHNLICMYCEEPAKWSRIFDQYWCPECRCLDVTERDEP